MDQCVTCDVTREERRHLLRRVGAAVLAQRREREQLLHPFAVLHCKECGVGERW